KRPGSALACLISWIGLVDDEGAPLAPHDAAVLVAFLQCLQRIDNLHTHVLDEGRNIGSGRAEVKPGRPGRSCTQGPMRLLRTRPQRAGAPPDAVPARRCGPTGTP